jgi:Zn-dependent peptidase ImmA (M78 family)
VVVDLPVLEPGVPGSAEWCANAIFDQYWDQSLPVDPVAIATKMGLEVYKDRIDGLSGRLVKTLVSAPIIVVNLDDASVRQRFTCAHEIGHYLQRQAHDISDIYEYVDNRDLFGDPTNVNEQSANQFAASLLMPKSLLPPHRSWAPEELVSLSQTFGVSTGAMRARLQSLHRIG